MVFVVFVTVNVLSSSYTPHTHKHTHTHTHTHTSSIHGDSGVVRGHANLSAKPMAGTLNIPIASELSQRTLSARSL